VADKEECVQAHELPECCLHAACVMVLPGTDLSLLCLQGCTAQPPLSSTLCSALHPTLASAEDFVTHFAKSIMMVCLQLKLTIEKDGLVACTSMECEIVAGQGQELRGEELLRIC
jgi:hypothetical protein